MNARRPTAAEAARDRLRRHSERAAPVDGVDAAEPVVPVGSAPPRVDPIRITVDLSPVLYGLLRSWCAQAADVLGRPRVTQAAVMRALIAELTDEAGDQEGLADRVRARLTGEPQ